MKAVFLFLCLLLPFTSAQAQLFTKVKKIVPVSQVPQVIEPESEAFEVSFKLLDKNDKKVKGKKISIEVTSGRSTISDVSLKSDPQGIVSFLFHPASYPEVATVKIEYAPVTSKVTEALDLNDNGVITYYQEFQIVDQKVDLKKSRAHMVSAKKLIQGSDTITIQVEMKNKFSQNIDSDEFDFSLEIDGKNVEKISRQKKSAGVYELHYAPPKKAGSYKLALIFNDEKIEENLEIIPKLDFKNIKVSLSKKERNLYELRADLFDLNNEVYRESSDVSTKLTSNHQELKIKKIDKLLYTIEVPEGEGSALLDFTLKENDIFEEQKKLDWVYFPYTLDDLYVKVYPETIMATGYDTASLEVHFKNLKNDQIKKISETDAFRAVISSGEGSLSDFVLRTDHSGKSYLAATFTAPFTPGVSAFEVHNKMGLIDANKKVSYDINIVRCESRNLVDYDTRSRYLEDNINLIQKVVDGLNKSQGFELTNKGPNEIVPKFWERSFDFGFPDQAKQLMKLTVNHHSNHPDAKVSATHMLSSFYFFPRTSIPRIIDEGGETVKVLLPTGEEVLFERSTNKIVGGVLEEGPVDARDDRFSRTFPDIRYKGKGYVLRANARGQMPESGNFNKSKISGEFGHKGGEGAMIYRYNEKTKKTESCVVSKTSVFEKIYTDGHEGDKNHEIGSVFKFATDEEFYAFVDKNCRFK